MGAQQLRRVVSERPAFLQGEPLDPKIIPDRMSGVASSLSQPPIAPPIDTSTRPRMVAPPEPQTVSSTGQVNDAQSIRERTVGPRIIYNNKGRPVSVEGGNDPVEANRMLIREQEGYKAPRSWKDQGLALLTGGVPGAIAYATDQNTRNRWAVGDDIASEEGQIARDLGIQGKQASVAATLQRPIFQQRAQDIAQQRVDQGDVRLDQGQQRVQQGQQRVDQGDTRLSRETPIDVDIDGQTFKVPPQVAARIKASESTATKNRDVRVSEGQKNREARAIITDKIIAAVSARQEKQIAASIAQLGDPQEMYDAASDLWSQAQSKEQQANSMQIATTADAETKKQLLAEATKLKEATVRIQQEARKATSAGRGRSAAASNQYAGKRISRANIPEAAKRLKMSPQQAEAYLKQQGAEIY